MIKPLATGAFVNAEGQPQAVHTTPLTTELSGRRETSGLRSVRHPDADQDPTAPSSSHSRKRTVRTAALEARQMAP